MIIEEFQTPRTHLVIREFFRDEEVRLIWREIEERSAEFAPAKYEIDGVEIVRPEIKRGNTIILNPHGEEIALSPIRLLFYNRLFYDDDMAIDLAKLDCPVYQMLRLTRDDLTKVMAYNTGDYYRWHTDQSPTGLLTVLLMLNKTPKQFEGGDFVLKWKDEEKIIPFENNKVIVFARNTPHCVTPVNVYGEDFWARRFSIQCFPNV